MSHEDRLRKLNLFGMEKVKRASSTTQGHSEKPRADSGERGTMKGQNRAAMSCILSHKTT